MEQTTKRRAPNKNVVAALQEIISTRENGEYISIRQAAAKHNVYVVQIMKLAHDRGIVIPK